MRFAICHLLIAVAALAQDPPRPGSIAGTVTAAVTGAPMKGVEVSTGSGTRHERTAMTDEQGRYVLRNVDPGNIRVSAHAPDDSGQIGFGPSASRQLRLAEAQELTGVDFKLVIPGKVAGRVLDQNKEPVVWIQVFLVAREYSYGALRSIYAGGGKTDDQGQYIIGRVMPGRAYYVLAKELKTLPAISDAPQDPKLRRPAVVPTFYPDANGIEGGQPLVLGPGELREGVDIRMTRSQSFCLDGVVEGANGPGVMQFSIQETQ